MNLKKYAALGVVTALLLHGTACTAPTERIPDAMLGAMIMCSLKVRNWRRTIRSLRASAPDASAVSASSTEDTTAAP